MDRPLIARKVAELELEFEERKDDPQFLRLLISELEHRSVARARDLRKRAEQSLRTAQPPKAKPSAPQPTTEVAPALVKPRRSIPGSPQSVVDAWTALEVLSPQSYRRPEDLAGGDKYAVARLDQGKLPWESGGERSRKSMRLYYQVVLGSLRLDDTVKRVIDVYVDQRVERPAARGSAALAVLVVDHKGLPVEAPAVGLSSFGWGVPLALAGKLEQLSGWPSAEVALVKALDARIRQTDKDGKELPVTRERLEQAYDWLVATLDMPRELAEPPSFAIRSYQYFKLPDPPELLLLNSFYLGDLARARELFDSGRATDNLRRYMGMDAPETRRDLLHDRGALEDALAPGKVPAARWPGKGRHPLVLLQQAAVNLAFQRPREAGILAVNGPPGTGKTTLLRDLVAALVTARAEAIAKFDDPEKAFTHSGEKLRAGAGWLHLYRLDAHIKGFEILVASSNNKAVENVSAELPGIDAVAEDAGLDYFSTLADALHAKDTWGLVAAVLGNQVNRAKFRQTFWWDDDVGLSTYLAAAAGTPQFVEETDEATGETIERPPLIVTREHPPAGHEDALARWGKARQAFHAALSASCKKLEWLESVRQAALQATDAEASLRAAEDAAALASTDLGRAQTALDAVREHSAEAKKRHSAAVARLSEHDSQRPDLLARFFSTASARRWRALRDPLVSAIALAQRSLDETGARLQTQEGAWREARQACEHAKTQRAAAAAKLSQLTATIDDGRLKLGCQFGDAAFFQQAHGMLHKSTPWLDQATQRARDDVFCAAMALHKAFVDAAAKPLRHNLGNLMNALSGRALPDEAKAALLPDLWSSLFLVVPAISTTFASVERMLGNLPPESLGWLLIDEAGQALPQAAVGALMRTRRAVVVGDPLQIEPVVVLPDTLTKAICRQFGADPDRFNAPEASAQTLADAATPFMAEFESRHGSRSVGVPLLVHRRCTEPMFGISNAVAYENLMVHAKGMGASPIRDVLGPSVWIDVQGGGADKWYAQEGEVALDLLGRLVNAGVGGDKGPDVYLVTPFVIVADNLRALVQKHRVAESWGGNSWEWTRERIGTVHTVQGREAEAVILVLGAPSPAQAGARGWAGGRPNLLNVAVTRAKEGLYVIGNRDLWRKAGVFQKLDERLPGSHSN
ncbi:MAG TPA: DEAD/DEAH box helicase [Magnetospirillum sp.]|nr:DEAD/DEAH box helicase [Magnetospirillum sp.]